MARSHGPNCTCRPCCMAGAAMIMAGQKAENAAKDHGGDRGKEAEWHKAEHGFVSSATGDRPVTFALGFGAREGELLLTDRFVSVARPGPFWRAGGHTYFGKGRGPKPVLAPPLVTNDRAEQRRADAIGRKWVPKSRMGRVRDWLA